MKKLFTPDEQVVIEFLKLHSRSTASKIARHTGLKHRGVLADIPDSFDSRGIREHTEDITEQYYLVQIKEE